MLKSTGDVVTLVGQGPSEWGAEDGAPDDARLQHPLGVAAAPDGRYVYLADTFNSALRVWDGETLRTLSVDGLDEPGGLDVLPDGRLVVADTNHHRVLVVDPHSQQAEPLELDDSWLMSTAGNALSARSGELVSLDVSVPLAEEELDVSAGEPVRVSMEARPASLLADVPSHWALDTAEGHVEARMGDPGEGLLLVEVVTSTRGAKGPAQRVRRVRHFLQVN